MPRLRKVTLLTWFIVFLWGVLNIQARKSEKKQDTLVYLIRAIMK